MADLTIDTKVFRAEVEGDATRPALMLSNSLGVDLSMWEGQIPDLTQHFRVIRYDTRGHGGSDGGDGPTSIAQLGRDALAILDALGIEKVHWVGLSMGGAIGLWLLANAPERIDRAVLANTAPKLGTPEMWNARITSVLGNGMEETAAATIERWFSADFITREPKQVEAIHDVLRKTSPEGYAACCAALRDMDLRKSLSSIDHEVLVVSGRQDPVVSGQEIKGLVHAIAGARHVALDALHVSNIEAAADFTIAIVSFLTAKPARTRAKPTGRQPAPAKAAPRKASARKAAAAKATLTKRGSATRRSNAARNPLKKAAAKGAVVKKVAPPARTKKKPVATRRPVAKAAVTRRAAPKVVAKKRPAKSSRKAVTARRRTPTTARSPVKVVPVGASTKSAAKKTTPSRTAVKVTKKTTAKIQAKTKAKTAVKTAAKTPAKKLPTSRRKPVAKPRRTAGRRKP